MSTLKLPDPIHPIYDPKTKEDLEELRILHKKFVRPQHVALHAKVPGLPHMSPSRSVMAIQQEGQHLVFEKMQKPIVLTGVEYPFGDFAFADEMPEDGRIVAVVPRYPLSSDPKTIRKNPETVVFYLKTDNTLDYFTVTAWGKYHPHFGYTKKMHESNLAKLAENRLIPKGTKFATSPGVADDGCYMTGINANVAYVDDEMLDQDGMVFREGFVKDNLYIDIYEEIEVSLGSKAFGINLLGDDKEHIMFPEIGDYIRHDGLVMVKRGYHAMNSPITMSKRSLRTPDATGADEFVYSRPTPLHEGDDPSKVMAGEVVDIIAIRNPKAKRMLPPTMSTQLERYAWAFQTFQTNLLKIEQRLLGQIRRNNPEARLKMTPRCQILLKNARGMTSFGANKFQGATEFQKRRARMDEWTVTFVIRHRREATKGDKFAGQMGDKGVMVQKLPDSYFPPGVDVMVAASSTIGRTNLNRKFVPRLATAAYDLTEDTCKELGFIYGKPIDRERIDMVDDTLFQKVMARIIRFYQICSPQLYQRYKYVSNTEKEWRDHLFYVLNEVIHPLTPIDNPVNEGDVIIHLQHEGYLKDYQPITYRNASGKIETTKNPVPVLRTHLIYLDKIAEDGSATSAGKVQHHGLLASRTNNERYQYNFRNVSTRNIGYHEGEILGCDSRSPELVAELIDRSNNPNVMRAIMEKLLTDEKPTGLHSLVDRNEHPLNEHRPRQLLRHFYETSGGRLSYMSEQEAALLPNLEAELNDKK